MVTFKDFNELEILLFIVLSAGEFNKYSLKMLEICMKVAFRTTERIFIELEILLFIVLSAGGLKKYSLKMLEISMKVPFRNTKIIFGVGF